MSMEYDQPPEETPAPASTGSPTQGRGYFFYIAALFILIGLLCYLLNSTNVTWTQVEPPAPTPATSSSPAPK